MGLIKSKNGYYYIRHIQNHKLTKFSLKTRNHHFAKELYSAYLKELVISHVPRIHENITKNHCYAAPEQNDTAKLIKPIFDNYFSLSKLKGFTKQTLCMKRKLLEVLIASGIRQFSDFQQEKINSLLSYLKERYSGDSVKKFISEIKAFLNYSIKQGLFERSIYEKLHFPSIQTKNRETVISNEDFNLIIRELKNNNNQDFMIYLKLLWYTGCRPNEITGIRKKDIDFLTKTIKIRQNKTKKEIVSIIPDVFFDELKAYINAQSITTDLILTGSHQGKEYYSKKFAKLKAKLRLNPLYNLYTFRHTFATNLINSTGDLHLVSTLLGHSDVSITAKHYINRNVKDFKNKINSYFSG